ncbi:MAG: peptidylprolyl isomerase [Acidobacteriota bacterium]|nr:peptidylprolyl isomerase [Acidobacteriota bacterium]
MSICVLVFGAFFPAASAIFAQRRTQVLHNPTVFTSVPKNLLLRIVRAEDERRWDNDLRGLLTARSAVVRKRAALAAGRIGNEEAVADLVNLLRHDDEQEVRAMAAFAIGEIESFSGAEAFLAVLKDSKDPEIRARTIEALGKIAAALPKEQESRTRELGAAILEALNFELSRRAASDRLTVLLGLTATLRAKPANAGPTVAQFLTYSDPRIRADAANTLARLKLKEANDQLRKLLISDPDPIVRANAARVLGVTEDKASFEQLLDRALRDRDSRVRVSAIRSLGNLKDTRATAALLKRGDQLLTGNLPREARDVPQQLAGPGEVLEVASALGRIKQGSNDSVTIAWLKKTREASGQRAPEVDVAFVRVSPAAYLAELGSGSLGETNAQKALLLDWRVGSSIAQGLAEIAVLPESEKEKTALATQAQNVLRAMLDYRNSGLKINTLVAVHSEYAIPDVQRALAAFKPQDLAAVLRAHLKDSDVVIRATAAELLGELPPDEINTRALSDALPIALADKELNDAALAILDSLAKYKTTIANEAIKTALNSSDYLIRRRAVGLLKANGAGDFSARIGTVQSQNTVKDYARAISRIGKQATATVTTNKGAFTIEMLPEDAPLNVDNFIQLAKRGYFNGITFHRVVPNFVIQGGDPRGDGNGGPGYQIRCEINEVPYERGAVGMALSGKDTGGSQWFVTHSPQPHLDGGYTVFGNVTSGMDVVDRIARGDVITRIVVTERPRVGPKSRHHV